MAKLMVGTDPEFFLRNTDNGKFKSAIGLVNGTKEKKVSLGNGHFAFPDNVNVEVNVAPGNSAEALTKNVKDCLNRLGKLVSPYQIELRASGEYPASECEHPDAKVFGCEAEYDAYGLSVVQAPSCTTTFRSCGGHIHLGFSESAYPLMASPDEDGGLDRAWGRVWVVRMMDLFVGIPSLFMDHDPTSAARRKLYGNAGTHRPKEEYGVEYRATGNFWLRSPALVNLTYRLCDFTVDFVSRRKHLEFWQVPENPMDSTCSAYKPEALQACINGSDKKKASEFLNGIVKKYLPLGLYNDILLACEPPAKPHCSATWHDLRMAWGF